jgi:hypothetical protein
MSDVKKSKNPFINMANEAKAKKAGQFPNSTTGTNNKAPKPTKGFATGQVMRKAGRGS